MEYVVIYDTITKISFIANFPGSNAVTQARKTRHSYDAVIVGRRFLPRQIPTHTHGPIQLQNGKLKQLHNENSTKSNRMKFMSITRSIMLLITVHFTQYL